METKPPHYDQGKHSSEVIVYEYFLKLQSGYINPNSSQHTHPCNKKLLLNNNRLNNSFIILSLCQMGYLIHTYNYVLSKNRNC